MIEREDGKVVITHGDGDVLTGCTVWRGDHPMVRLWAAPKPGDYPYGLHEVVSVPRDETRVPDDAALVMFFLDRESIDGYVTMLTRCRDRAFPEPAKGEGGPC